MSGAENQASNFSEKEKDKEKEEAVSLKGWLAVIGSAVGAFMAVLDIQITSSSMQNIQGALGASLDEGSWISTAYLIAEIVTIPLTGWLSQVFGVKRYVVVNAVLFVIFSMCCGLAHDLNTMIIFRALQGFTGGTLIPMSFLIILSTLPPAKQPVGLAMFSLTAVFAPSIGPAIGGFLTDTWGWLSAPDCHFVLRPAERADEIAALEAGGLFGHCHHGYRFKHAHICSRRRTAQRLVRLALDRQCGHYSSCFSHYIFHSRVNV